MPRRENRIAGGILAGGASRRLGGVPKGRIRLDGTPLLQRTLDLLAGLFEEVILVANDPRMLPPALLHAPPPGLLLARDPLPGRGPLAGIQAGLARTSREAVFFVACDMPFLQPQLIRRMARGFLESGCDIRLPRIWTLDEPLHAIYRTRLAGPMYRQLAAGGDLSIRTMFEPGRTCWCDLDDTPANHRVFFNLNTPEDLRRLEAEGWTVDLGETEGDG